MATNRIRWNIKAFEQIRRLPGVEANLRKRVESIAEACGDGYEPHVDHGLTRTRGSVVAASFRAKQDNARNNTLLKSMSRGGNS